MGGKTTRMFVKRPIIVEAFQFGYEEEPSWFAAKHIVITDNPKTKKRELKGCIETLEGEAWFWEGDYVIRGVKGELYPCRRDIFEETYDEVIDSIS
jgi:hypothetical protein